MPNPCSAVSSVQTSKCYLGLLKATCSTPKIPGCCGYTTAQLWVWQPEATQAVSTSGSTARAHPLCCPRQGADAVHSQRHPRCTKKSFISKSIARQPTQFPSLSLLRHESSVKNIISSLFLQSQGWANVVGGQSFKLPRDFWHAGGQLPVPTRSQLTRRRREGRQLLSILPSFLNHLQLE